MSSVLIVGAGVGGLAAAVRLLAAGHQVTLLERAATVGGKMRQISVGGYTFDGGPSVMTMPWVFEELCQRAGVQASDLLRLTRLDPLCRHFFADGTKLDLFSDEPLRPGQPAEAAWARSREAIAQAIGSDAGEQYQRFRQRAAAIYRAVEKPFLRSAIPSHPLGFVLSHSLADVFGLARIDSRRTLWQSLCELFDDERLRILFARYATYSGADPFVAPATLSVIPHVEQAFGVYAVEGGMYRLAEALGALVERLGGTLRTGAEVDEIELDRAEKRAVAVRVAGERLEADLIVVNCDVPALHGRLLRHSRLGARLESTVAALPPSLSAYLILAVAEKVASLPLCHHNVFFSADYRHEFRELATQLPTDPTVYLCSPDAGRDSQRWFFLTNAPALAADRAAAELSSSAFLPSARALYRQRVEAKLQRHQLPFSSVIRAEAEVTPADFAALFPGSRGALYGAAASSRLAAFQRPPNRVPGVKNLYCVGGSTHPGAGVPMVMLSAAIVCDLIRRDHR